MTWLGRPGRECGLHFFCPPGGAGGGARADAPPRPRPRPAPAQRRTRGFPAALRSEGGGLSPERSACAERGGSGAEPERGRSRAERSPSARRRR